MLASSAATVDDASSVRHGPTDAGRAGLRRADMELVGRCGPPYGIVMASSFDAGLVPQALRA